MINKERYKLAVLTLLSLLSFFVQAQDRVLTNESDTTFWFPRYVERFCIDLEIPTIDKSPENYEIRFWDDYKVIRLWSGEDNLRGEVIYFICQYHKADGFNKYRQGKVHYKKVPLSDWAVRSIEYMMSDLEISKIPSKDLIEGWPESNDGSIGIIESSTPESFTFKNYSLNYLGLKEGRFISYFFNQLNALGDMERDYKEFIDKQPFRIYRKGWGRTELGFSSFLSRWSYSLDRKLFGTARERKQYRRKAKERAEADSSGE